MENCVHREVYKGLTIKIYPDTDAQSPDDWGNEDLFLITTNNRYFVVERKGFTLDGCRDGEYKKDYHCLPLIAYIHGGVALSLGRGGQFSCPWDSGQIGYVLVKKRQGFRNIRKAAESLVSEWNDYLSGNVYGFVVERDGETVDSCWGFFGDYKKYCLIEARQAADYEVAKEKECSSLMGGCMVSDAS